ncbi:MAG: hypothetical protein ACO3K7_03025 [Candidatus Marinamargulisbacteria bacterium]
MKNNKNKQIHGSFIGVCLAIIMMMMPVHGASYFMITDLGSSAEMIRKGNIEGFSAGANSVFENPAGLYRVNTLSTSVFATTIMKEVNYRNVSLAFKSSIGVIAVGYMDAGVDDIITTTMDSNKNVVANGTFSYKNRVIKVGYQNTVTDQLHWGVNAVGYMNELHTYSGTGYNIDAGLIYLLSNLEVSLFARNLIPMQVTYSDSEDKTYSGKEDMPLQTILSLGYGWGDLDMMGQFKYDGVNTLIGAGLDYTPGFLWDALTLSVGYKEFSVLDSTDNTMTFGVGLNLFGLSLDYAYEKSDHFEYDANNFASVGIDF